MQPNAVSIQEVIETSLEKLLGTRPKLHSSGRTDAGVHALAQVAHMKLDTPIDYKTIQYKMNCLLPKDISIQHFEEADPSFHARFSAVGKTYTYYIHTSKVVDPFTHRFRTHIRFPLDLPLMEKAAELFVGTYDFTSFANEANKGSAKNNPIKTIYSLKIDEIPGGISLTFCGNGFLYKMVRNIVGALLKVGSHKLPIEEIPKIFAARDRKKAPMAASPKGLFLVSVEY